MTAIAPNPGSASGDKFATMMELDDQLSLLWRRARAINLQLTRSVHPDLEPAAYGLLSVLLSQGQMRLTVLAKHVGVGKPSVSRQIALLMKLGLVHKDDDPVDGRAQLIGLTEAGKEKMRTIQAGRQTAFHERLAGWDSAELAALTALLAKLNTV